MRYPHITPHLKYLRYVLRHKWFVFRACFYYGLYWRGIKHDWSKFLPSEWFPYVEHFYGDNKNEYMKLKEQGYDYPDYAPYGTWVKDRFNVAWNHHEKRNDHHWQYWVLMEDSGAIIPLPMPDVCRKEMLADWHGAGKALGKPNTWEWYEANKDKMQLHPETRRWVEKELAKWKDMHRVGVMLGFEHDV